LYLKLIFEKKLSFFNSTNQKMINILFTLKNTWMNGTIKINQYDIIIKNEGDSILNYIAIHSTNRLINKYWSVELNKEGNFIFPTWITKLAPGEQFKFGCEITGDTSFIDYTNTTVVNSNVAPVINSNVAPIVNSNVTPIVNSNVAPVVNSNVAPVINSNVAPIVNSNVTPIVNSNVAPVVNSNVAPVVNSNVVPVINISDDSKMDKFGVKMVCPSSTINVREWYNNWNNGALRTCTFGTTGSNNDPELIFRGSGTYTIYGSNNSRTGQMRISGSCPRIYVRDSIIESDILASSVKKWGNVEVTFYANTTNPGSNISYAGIEAVVRTNHYPDNLLCSTRGYGGKINFDGRAQFEKECCHGSGNKQTNSIYPFPNKGRMPLNTWIGFKMISRACENNTKVKLELYMDLTDGLNGGNWVKLIEFTDYEGWSSDTPACCATHTGKVLLPPHCISNYSIYLRSDGLGEQFYKKFSIREIDPLP